MSTIKLQSKPNTIEVRPLPADGGGRQARGDRGVDRERSSRRAEPGGLLRNDGPGFTGVNAAGLPAREQPQEVGQLSAVLRAALELAPRSGPRTLGP